MSHFDLKVFSVYVENSFDFTNKLGLLWLQQNVVRTNEKSENSLGNEITKNSFFCLADKFHVEFLYSSILGHRTHYQEVVDSNSTSVYLITGEAT